MFSRMIDQMEHKTSDTSLDHKLGVISPSLMISAVVQFTLKNSTLCIVLSSQCIMFNAHCIVLSAHLSAQCSEHSAPPEASSHLTPGSQNHVSGQQRAMQCSSISCHSSAGAAGYSANDSRLFNGRAEGLMLDHLYWQWWLILDDEDDCGKYSNANPITRFMHIFVCGQMVWQAFQC